ncbi:aspartate-semialdehyde dehydrogenase [Candidatus Persebacteraceae bacterium Df01]|jgi:aspartate-semialdehyde dehydrogenase|uniref:Aspartate-semialdehyde dehydrogenase n=1 Tax=Candidatus Doriopsillibacter californiensis TaxID=2970740 RepID=A0ABT7QMQ5_9GAMM|nr:aspartate-semialdehyde dehydrogenase [Candidatus Persebacteraceae bacterium Df01]
MTTTDTPTFDIAVVGATGTVGEQMLAILEERNFPVRTLYALASERSVAKTVSFGNKTLTVQDLAKFDFSQVQIALFSAGGSVSAEHAPRAAACDCVVIDNSSHFRRDEGIPLVVAEVNPEQVDDYCSRNIIANPNCSTMQMLVALKPLYDAVGITRINVATYQAVSGAGARAIDELAQQTAARLAGNNIEPSIFTAPIAFNVIPHIDSFQENGYTREEMKMVWETKKILADDTIQVNPTAVRVPVFYGHAEAVHIETLEKLDAQQARMLLADAPGVCVIDEHIAGGYPTPQQHAAGNNEVFVGRIREDISHPKGLNLWVVSDNVRKGAALNAVQIAEILALKLLANTTF